MKFKKEINRRNIKKKSQGGIEFIMVFGAALFFFVTFYAIIQQNVNEKDREKETAIAQDIALDVQNEIAIASGSSDGYSRHFNVPQNIFGKDYDISLVDGFVYVFGENLGISFKIHEINGTIKKGDNFIRKENGKIFLN